MPVLRVSILRCPAELFPEVRRMMQDAEPILRPGMEALPGFLSFYAGADEAASSLTNVSFWTSLEAAKQMDSFQPMLDLAKPFMEMGATFERPIMNYATLWQSPTASSKVATPKRPLPA